MSDIYHRSILISFTKGKLHIFERVAAILKSASDGCPVVVDKMRRLWFTVTLYVLAVPGSVFAVC